MIFALTQAEMKTKKHPHTLLNRQVLVPALLILFALLAIYAQALWFGYVNYDDLLIQGKRWLAYRELSWEALRDLFSFRSGATYQPLRDAAFALVYRFSGTDPFGYHLFNLILYAANVLVVFFLFRKLLKLSLGSEQKSKIDFWAWVATAWFAVHPVHVEAVAWMVANKELLAGLFYFLSFLSYLTSRERGFSFPFYASSWFFLVFGLLSKPSVAALPLVVIAFELLYLGRDFNWEKLALRIGPFLVLVAAAAIYYVSSTTAFTGEFLQGSLRVHALTMASVLAKYVKILLFPVNLCNSYPPGSRIDRPWRLW